MPDGFWFCAQSLNSLLCIDVYTSSPFVRLNESSSVLLLGAPRLLRSARDIVLYRHKDLTKASKIVLQPHSSAFLKMSNHQAVMETELRHYSAISRGEPRR